MEVPIPLKSLSVRQLKDTIKENKDKLTEQGIMQSLQGATEKSELISGLQAAGIQPKIKGFDAIKYKAKLIMNHVEQLQYEVEFAPGAPLGIEFRSTNEWAIVASANRDDVKRGSVVVAVNGTSVLLEPYDTAISTMVAAKDGDKPFKIVFRLAPWKTGTLWKHDRKSRGTYGMGWRRRYFILAYGMLAYYDKKGGKLKGHYMLDCVTGHQTIVAPAPAKLAGNNGAIMVVKGNDRLIMKSNNMEEMMDWAAMLYMAVAHTNGGSTEMYEAELNRLQLQADAAEYAQWLDKVKLQAEEARAEMLEAERREAETAAAAAAAPAEENDDEEDDAEEVEVKQYVKQRRSSRASFISAAAILDPAAAAGGVAAPPEAEANPAVTPPIPPAAPEEAAGPADAVVEPTGPAAEPEVSSLDNVIAEIDAGEKAEVEKAIEAAETAIDNETEAEPEAAEEDEEEDEEAMDDFQVEPPPEAASAAPEATNPAPAAATSEEDHEAHLLQSEALPELSEVMVPTGFKKTKGEPDMSKSRRPSMMMKVKDSKSWIKHSTM